MLKSVLRPIAVSAALASALALGTVDPAQANMQVAPLVMDLEGTTGTQASFGVRNTSAQDIPVAISVFRRDVGPDGQTALQPAEGDFVIFPPQAVVPEGQAQLFRFQYAGPPVDTSSRSYYVYASQLPIDLEAGEELTPGSAQARLSFLYEYAISVNISPANAVPDLVVAEAQPSRMEDGSPAVKLTIENRGTRYGRVAEHRLTIEAGSETVTFEPEQLKQGLGNGFWLPGQSFAIDFPVTSGASGPIRAELTFVGE